MNLIRPGELRRAAPWIAASALVLLTVAVMISLEQACGVSGRRIVMKQSGVLGCAEFWLSKYQTLIGAILALGAAFIAVRPVWMQLRELRYQSNRQEFELFRSLYAELTQELNASRRVAVAVRSLNISEDTIRRGAVMSKSEATAVIDFHERNLQDLRSHIETFMASAIRGWGGAIVTRSNFMLQSQAFQQAANSYKYAIEQEYFQLQGPKLYPEQFVRAAEHLNKYTMRDESSVFEDAAKQHFSLLVKEKHDIEEKMKYIEDRVLKDE